MLELRASEMCGLKSHFIHNGVEKRPRTSGLASYRMALGVMSEPLAVDRLRAQGHIIVQHDQSHQLEWSDGSFKLTGTPDDFVIPDESDGSHAQIIEQKLTSHGNFTKVRRGLQQGLIGDRAGSLDDYKTQGRRYAALAALNGLVIQNVKDDGIVTRHPVDPTQIWLSVTDRDSCEQLFEPTQVFETAWEDFKGFVRREITTHRGDGSEEPPKPRWANPNHPKCEGCEFAYRCWWNHKPDAAYMDYQQFGERWSQLATDEKAADADLKEIQGEKKQLKALLSDKLKADGLERADIGGFTASFGKTPVRFLADQDLMKADKVHKRYNKNRDVVAGTQLYIRKGKSK